MPLTQPSPRPPLLNRQAKLPPLLPHQTLRKNVPLPNPANTARRNTRAIKPQRTQALVASSVLELCCRIEYGEKLRGPRIRGVGRRIPDQHAPGPVQVVSIRRRSACAGHIASEREVWEEAFEEVGHGRRQRRAVVCHPCRKLHVPKRQNSTICFS